MKRLISISAAVLVAVLLAPVSRASSPPLDATLSFSPGDTLPGIPVTAELRLHNNSSGPVDVPRFFAVRVRPEGASSSSLLHFTYGFLLPLPDYEEDDKIILQPGKDLSIRWEAEPRLLQPTFGVDEHGTLLAPGVFHIRVLLFPQAGHWLSDTDWSGPAPSPEEFDSQAAVVSSEATLSVAVPVGDDREIWEKVRSITAGRVSRAKLLVSDGVAAELFDRYPSSRYAPFLVAYVGPARWLSDVDRAIAVAPPSVADRLRVKLVTALRFDASEASRTDTRRAEELLQRAERVLRTLQEKSADPKIRVFAQEQLATLPDSKTIAAQRKE